MAFGLYLHWPYCESKCPYCDFNSHVAERIDSARWISAYRQEIERVAALTSNEVLSTIFIGGGTPSLMPSEIVSAIIDTAKRSWRCANELEVSMEANPGSVEIGRFRAYREAGVNRISLGIQSLDDLHLKLLGRKHTSADAVKAIGIAQETFERINLDLIYGRQHQSPAEWRDELKKALSFQTGHLSLYQLTIEDGTVFSKRLAAGQLLGLPDEDKAVAFFESTQELCDDAGLTAYEVSNHGRPGEECRHNLIYWNGKSYAGIGPGAHGRLGQGSRRLATEAVRNPLSWLKAVERLGSGDCTATPLDAQEQSTEAILMGLRLTAGIPLADLHSLGIDTDGWQSMKRMIQDGFLRECHSALSTTKKGRLLLNAVIKELLSDLRLRQT